MINQRIGSFISALRKEKNLTQEQLAEKIGVSNRSVSRWENGNTLPDLSLMYSICNVLGITMSELLSGSRQEGDIQQKDTLLIALELSDREKRTKQKKLNFWFALALAALISAILASFVLTALHAAVLAGFGILFHAIGFYHNNHDRPRTFREKAVLITQENALEMRFADEMLQFAKKYQNAGATQYKASFQYICENLEASEHAIFSMVANEFSVNGNPGLWHAGIAVTEKRILLCGEAMIGLLMPRRVLESFARNEITSLRYENHRIMLSTPECTVTIRGENIKPLFDKLKNAVKRSGTY